MQNNCHCVYQCLFKFIQRNTMSTRYKFVDNNAVYFTTSTVVGWTDIFTREMYKTILLDSIRHCQQSQGLKIHAWVLMTNHLHTICSCKEGYDLGLIWRNIKSFTAMKLIDAIINNSKESRKEYLLHIFETEGKKVAAILGISFGNMKTILYYWIVPQCTTSV